MMADMLPSPPTSRSSTPEYTKNRDALTSRLDELLEQYLVLLHQYTTLREDLSKTLSSGFFSLAQAQRGSTLGAGRRYGEECYDERMKAQRKIVWSNETDRASIKCEVVKDQQKGSGEDKHNETDQATVGDRGNIEENSVANDALEEDHSDGDKSETLKMRVTDSKKKQDPAQRDPLTWFGILVPPALRQTQAYFVQTIEERIPELLSIDFGMKMVEHQVKSVRQQLGIGSEYDRETADTGEPPQPTEVPQDVTAATSTKDSKVSRKSLASRPAHSKSHLIKLGD